MCNKNIVGLFSNLLGDPATHTFENRTFNVVMLIISITGLAAFGYDFFLSNHVTQMVDIFCSLYPLGCYFYSRKTKSHSQLIIQSFFCFYLALSVAWFFNSGLHGSTSFFFFILASYAAVFFKKPFGYALPLVLVSVVIFAIFEFYYSEFIIRYHSKIQDSLDMSISLILCLVINSLIIHVIFNKYTNERILNSAMLKQALADRETIKKSMDEIQILRGFIPICSHCKKIRDSTGDWKQMEEYIQDNSEAKFSHTMCDDCALIFYPEYVIKFPQKKQAASSEEACC